jgi:RNA polymerase sigma-70 factor (ECF subfamily)
MDDKIRQGAGNLPTPQETYSEPTLSVEQVYHAYAPRVYSTVRRMVGNALDAEDVTQDVLLQVVRKLPSFRGESAFPTWLHRLTINAALSHRRKQAVREERRVRDPLEFLLEGEGCAGLLRHSALRPEAPLLTSETRHLIERAIARLPETYRTVFVLADVEEMPNAAVAATLGLSLPAIKSRLHRARQLLRDALAPHFDEVSVG